MRAIDSASDDSILILRTMLIKTKRLLKLKKEVENSKNMMTK